MQAIELLESFDNSNNVTMILLVLVLLILYWLLIYPLSTFRRMGICGPTPLPLLGNFLTLYKKGFPEVMKEWTQEYGRAFGIFIGLNPTLVIMDPDMLREILVKQFHCFRNRSNTTIYLARMNYGLLGLLDDDWKRVRNALSPAFSSGKLKRMFPLFCECTENLLERFKNYSESGRIFNVNKVFEAFAMDSIASSAFGVELNTQKNHNSSFVKNGERLFQMATEFNLAFLLTILFPRLQKLWLFLRTKSHRKLDAFWDITLEELYNLRTLGKEERLDMFQLMLDASLNQLDKSDVTDGDPGLEEENDDVQYNKPLSKGFITKEEIFGNIMVFLLAGFETTSNALSFTAYLLALNPDKQRQLFKEIEEKIGTETVPTYEDIGKLQYLDLVFSESLRMYPPLHRFQRYCNETCVVKDLIIQKGTSIIIPVHTMQNSEQFWPQADKFIPERFLHENSEEIKPYSYLPFGVGPRMCIGMRLAQLEAKLAMARVIQKYKFVRSSKTEVPLQLLAGITMTAKNGIFIKIQKQAPKSN